MSNCIKVLYLIILFSSIQFNCRCGKEVKDDITIYRVVPPAKPPFDKEKYSFVDTTKPIYELKRQAYLTENTLERMQIYDYFFVYGTERIGSHELGQFFKHLDNFDGPDYEDTREMDLIRVAIGQDTYLKVKEHCLYRMILYEASRCELERSLEYMDSLRIRFYSSKLRNRYDYEVISDAVVEINDAMSIKDSNEPEYLWRLGYAYWKVAFSSIKSPWSSCSSLAYDYVNRLITKYPENPYMASAKFILMRNEYYMATQGEIDTTCGIEVAKEFEKLLVEYPETIMQDEMLLFIARANLYKTRQLWESNPDSAKYYLNKADSCTNQIVAQFPNEEARVFQQFKSTRAEIKQYKFRLRRLFQEIYSIATSAYSTYTGIAKYHGTDMIIEYEDENCIGIAWVGNTKEPVLSWTYNFVRMDTLGNILFDMQESIVKPDFSYKYHMDWHLGVPYLDYVVDVHKNSWLVYSFQMEEEHLVWHIGWIGIDSLGNTIVDSVFVFPTARRFLAISSKEFGLHIIERKGGSIDDWFYIRPKLREPMKIGNKFANSRTGIEIEDGRVLIVGTWLPFTQKKELEYVEYRLITNKGEISEEVKVPWQDYVAIYWENVDLPMFFTMFRQKNNIYCLLPNRKKGLNLYKFRNDKIVMPKQCIKGAILSVDKMPDNVQRFMKIRKGELYYFGIDVEGNLYLYDKEKGSK